MKQSKRGFVRLFVLLILACVTSTQASDSFPKNSSDDFKKMTFEVELNKDNYVLLEPIFINFKLSNQTGVRLTTFDPAFMQESKLKVTFNGVTSTFSPLSSITEKLFRLPNVFQHNESLISDEILGSSFVGAFFPKSGNYQLQFVLRNSAGNKTLESNVIEVTISDPQGIDKEAFDFLKKHKDFFGMSSWIVNNKDDEALLETFVNNYSQSVYGELVINSLGSFYLSQGKLDKAQTEFEKIKFSEHLVISKDANRCLLNIERKRGEILKQVQH